jgi:hypothetical protein
MSSATHSWPSDDPEACRRCVRCGSVLAVTPEDELRCPRCGRGVRAWTVVVSGHVVAAGRTSFRGGVGIWLAGSLDDLRPAARREPAGSRSGWNEES